MSKAKLPSLSSPLSPFPPKQSDATDLATFRTFVSELKNDPAKLRAIAVKAGIITPTGKLTKAYKA
jgi:hypothetical protein